MNKLQDIAREADSGEGFHRSQRPDAMRLNILWTVITRTTIEYAKMNTAHTWKENCKVRACIERESQPASIDSSPTLALRIAVQCSVWL